MRWSNLFCPTLREVPGEATAPSHELLLRAGYIRQLMAGHYSLLPLGVRVRAKVIGIVRSEMESIGAQEFLLPTMHPVDIWERSGRRDAMDIMFTLRTRRDEEVVLGPTHEEIFTHLFSEVRSYKELPQSWYQFQTKFRDEPRAKGGLLRVREFTMKDAYSFDIDEVDLDASFEAFRNAYVRIFERLGIPAKMVEASNGSMGGSDSMEFMSVADVGEDDIVFCDSCGYAANIERATSLVSRAVGETGPDKPERFDTPGLVTIATLADAVDFATSENQIKTLVYVADDEVVLALLRGDHDLVDQKLIDAIGCGQLRPAHADEVRKTLGASPGSLGAVDVTGLRIFADDALRGRKNMVTGANIDGVHLRGVEPDRDIGVTEWVSLRRVHAQDPCPSCGDALDETQAIEVGHIFKLGRKFTNALDVNIVGPDGKAVVPIMGCYGIGMERAMAAIVERHHDDKGIAWPASVAPFEVVVVALNAEDEAVMNAAEVVYSELRAKSIDVLLDDRNARAGVKLADTELIGIPLRVSIGKRGLTENLCELTLRSDSRTRQVELSSIVPEIVGLLPTLLDV